MLIIRTDDMYAWICSPAPFYSRGETTGPSLSIQFMESGSKIRVSLSFKVKKPSFFQDPTACPGLKLNKGVCFSSLNAFVAAQCQF